MEAHRNTWLALVGVAALVGAAFLAWALQGTGDFSDRPGTPWMVGFFAAVIVFFVLALRQVKVPLLRGAEAALLYRELGSLHRQIDNLIDHPSDADVERITAAIRTELSRYAPHFLGQFSGDVFRGNEQAAPVKLEYIRQGIGQIMRHLESGGAV